MREAQEVVAHADSLREAHLYAQNEYDDSLSLAQAYETLKEIPLPFRMEKAIDFCFRTEGAAGSVAPTIDRLGLNSSYAHACYHYGRMLRAKDNHVEAMKVFIDATHSRTRDYYILGRIYSNMGSMCHLAGEYQLSYDMFAKCADCFLQKGDSSNYFYALNRMAFELAEQGKKDETLVLLDSIARNCNDKNVILKTWETKAEMYREISQYDSAIYYANQMQLSDWIGLTGIMIKAQSFYRLNEKDSALLYANLILNNPYSSYQNRFNALYIVTNGDSTLSKERIREYASQREDIRYYEHEPKQNQLSQAVQLLKQDLTRKPNLWWLYSVGLTLTITGICIVIYVHRKRKKQGLLVQQIEKLRQETSSIQKKHNDLEEQYMSTQKHIEEDINKTCSLMRTNESIQKTLAWKNYKKMCSIADRRFYFLVSKLQKRYLLNEIEVRICVLTLLNCEYERMAELLYRSPLSIGTLKMRVAKKLGTTAKELRKYLIENECVS